jgi:hypothetical protein
MTDPISFLRAALSMICCQNASVVGSVRIWRSKSDPPVGIGDLEEIRVFETEKMPPFANRRRPLRLAWRLVRQSGSLRRSGKY